MTFREQRHPASCVFHGISEEADRAANHVAIDPRHHAIQAPCTDRVGDEIELNVASNNGESSSIFPLGNHAAKYPDITYQSKFRMQSRTLDDVIFSDDSIQADMIDCLVMDVQGAEMKVIAGARRTLAQCRFVFTEVNEGGLYQGDKRGSASVATRSFQPSKCHR